MTGREPGALPHTYWTIQEDGAVVTDGGVIEESLVSLYVNGQELATLMCSPLDQEDLAVGFLYSEGVIESIQEVGLVKANAARSVVDVFLTRSEFALPRRLILTSGCGTGVMLSQLTEAYPALDSDFATTPAVLFDRMRDLQGAARLYRLVRGVHAAVLADQEKLLASAEDVGRHNALDKIAGKALRGGIPTRDRIILTSGRISSEMLSKARRMNVPLVASRTAPTSTAVQLAAAWKICVVGYLRAGSLRVYTHPQRVGLPLGHDPLPRPQPIAEPGGDD